jgi:hypothetical protein
VPAPGEAPTQTAPPIEGFHPAPPPTGVTVEGRVVSAESGKPLAGVLVLFIKPGVPIGQINEENFAGSLSTKAVSNSRGRFKSEVPLARGQSYGVVILAKGYAPVAEDDGVATLGNITARLDLGTIKLRRQ